MRNQWFIDSVVGMHGHVMIIDFLLKAKLLLRSCLPNGFYKNSDGAF